MFLNSLSAKVGKLLVEKTLDNGYTWGDVTNVTLSGIAIVFGMLVLLVFIILVFGFIMGMVNPKNKAPKVQKAKVEKKKTVKPSVASVPTAVASDDDEVIAVIAAAVNAMYEGSGKKPIIRTIKRADRKVGRSAWGSAGVFENTRAF